MTQRRSLGVVCAVALGLFLAVMDGREALAGAPADALGTQPWLRSAVVRGDRQMARSRAQGALYAPIGVLANESLDDRFWTQGTAFLVGPCHALTAAHNVVGTPRFRMLAGYPHDASAVAGARLTLLLGQGLGTSFGHVVRARVATLGQFDPGDRNSRTEDYALLELADCVGRQYGHIRLWPAALDALIAAPGTIISGGYPADRDYREGVWIEEGCSIAGQAPGAAAGFWGHDCTTSPGMSGGPLMVKGRDAQLYAVAVHKDGVSGTQHSFIPALWNGAVSVATLLPRIQRFVCPCGGPSPAELSFAVPTRDDAFGAPGLRIER
jgi:hypothetical protein